MDKQLIQLTVKKLVEVYGAKKGPGEKYSPLASFLIVN